MMMMMMVKNPLRRRGAHEEEGVVVGLEIHLQLTSLKTKLFSPGSVLRVGAGGSASGSPVVHAFDRAEPGTLPSPVNEAAVQCALKLATALHATCEKVSEFDRKHYFYGDLPHGYQITQHRKPILTGGRINENVRVERVQLEMDTGKTLSSLLFFFFRKVFECRRFIQSWSDVVGNSDQTGYQKRRARGRNGF